MKKVYCKNCKWCDPKVYTSKTLYHCRFVYKVVIDCIGNIHISESRSDCYDLNSDFDCSNYERKRWKLWIKK